MSFILFDNLNRTLEDLNRNLEVCKYRNKRDKMKGYRHLLNRLKRKRIDEANIRKGE